MACPQCGCKTTYCYDEGDDMPGGDERQSAAQPADTSLTPRILEPEDDE